MAAVAGAGSKSAAEDTEAASKTSEEPAKIIVLLDKACLETVKTKKVCKGVVHDLVLFSIYDRAIHNFGALLYRRALNC